MTGPYVITQGPSCLDGTMGELRTDAPHTYVNDAGNEKHDRRCRERDNNDPRIDHLFNGFDNMIQNADEYSAGYLRAMRQEFGQLIAALVR